jgi:hypothetical protein
MSSETPEEPVSPGNMSFDNRHQPAPIVDDPSLPVMDAVETIAEGTGAGEGGTLMPQQPAPPGRVAGGMEPVPDLTKGRPFLGKSLGELLGQETPAGPAAFPDQQKPMVQAQPKAVPEGYVRFLVRVDGAELSILSAKLVDGPLVRPATVGAGYVYEVTSAGSHVTLEWLPDAGVSRAFANIDRPEAHLGHEARELTSFEFTVRVPLGNLNRGALTDTQVALYRIAAAPEQPLTSELLANQIRDAVQIARLRTLDLARLESPVRDELSRILGPPQSPA